MESDTDSERDRRAYGQYASLAAEGDSDIDEEAALYLRSVRDEARALPDVMISDYEPQQIMQAVADGNRISTGHELSGTDIQAGPEWITRFMEDFLKLRIGLQKLELRGTEDADEVMEDSDRQSRSQNLEQQNGADLGLSEDASALQLLSGLLRLDKETVASRLEEEVDRVSSQGSITAEDVYSIYGLCAVLDYPLMASTEASLVQLLRSCKQIRLGSNSEVVTAYLDVLETIAGAYFGQDLNLRRQYREQGPYT